MSSFDSAAVNSTMQASIKALMAVGWINMRLKMSLRVSGGR